ncbi:MAG: YbjN domain-containing protein [Phreatobacter sp.]|uniref:YbjN domain-containing protein n=1 Tax=Phreatobacter sp. TaxID=1966341 RepID=UPI001A436EAB|nr:YbjN domain-containing protein [Phreatobacter sp.]MBL8571593.1 YbjN domain-containing protein [Phreatobacter sp.]
MTKRPTTLAALAALALIAGFAPSADAQKRQPRQEQSGGETLDRITPNQMAGLLRNRGHRAEIVSENNRTRLRTQIGNRRVTVFFYACNDTGCQSIQYRALFERNDRFTHAFVNAWNYEKRFAKTYIDSDGDLVLEWDVDFDGGVTVGFISESVQTFQTMLTAFDRFTPRDQGAGSAGGQRAPAPAAPDSSGGRSTSPGMPPSSPGQAQPDQSGGGSGGGSGGKSNTGDRPGERRT